MSSSIHPYVTVTLDKERHLCYGAAAFIEFKEYTGQDLLKFMRNMAEKFSDFESTQEFPITELRDILWAGLIHEDPDLQPRAVSNMFSLLNLTEIIPLVMEAFTLSLPKADTPNPRPAPVKHRK